MKQKGMIFKQIDFFCSKEVFPCQRSISDSFLVSLFWSPRKNTFNLIFQKWRPRLYRPSCQVRKLSGQPGLGTEIMAQRTKNVCDGRGKLGKFYFLGYFAQDKDEIDASSIEEFLTSSDTFQLIAIDQKKSVKFTTADDIPEGCSAIIFKKPKGTKIDMTNLAKSLRNELSSLLHTYTLLHEILKARTRRSNFTDNFLKAL